MAKRIITAFFAGAVIVSVAIFGCSHKAIEFLSNRSEVSEGCMSCHEKLSETFPQDHVDISPEELKYCMMCHTTKNNVPAFEWISHYMHYANAEFVGDCWSCHLIDEEGILKVLGAGGENRTKMEKDMTEEFSPYFHSWATSQYLDHRHAQEKIRCGHCHKTLSAEEEFPMEKCVECHGGYQHVATLTKDVEPNPHDSHLGNIECTL